MKLFTIGMALGAGALGLIACLAPLANAQNDQVGIQGEDAEAWTCAMHPNIKSTKAGKCPLCGMDLIDAKAHSGEGIPGRSAVVLSDRQQQLINIRIAPARVTRMIETLRVPGHLEHDSSKVYRISAWTSGRIESLIVDQEEAYIEKGDTLFEIYSPNLYEAMREYVALSNVSSEQTDLLRAARIRLLRMGLEDSQIDAIGKSQKPPETIEIKARTRGVVMEKHVLEGQYVQEGDALFTIVDLSELWLILEVYESDLPFLKIGQKVVSTSSAYSGESFVGVVELVNHHIDPVTRSARVRVVFEQPVGDGAIHHDRRLLPDMWMEARVESDLGDVLSIPSSAIFDTGYRQHVFVAKGDGLFVPVEVDTGTRVDDRVAILSGLEEGDLVVVDGMFLIDSESLLRAPAQANTGSRSGFDGNGDFVIGIPANASDKLHSFWDTFLGIGDSLASDSIVEIDERFARLSQLAEELSASELLPELGKERYFRSLESIRTLASRTQEGGIEAVRNRFGSLSEAVIAWARIAPETVKGELSVARCPMWESSPNEWIQAGEAIENPFMGSSMLRCGAIESALGQGASE